MTETTDGSRHEPSERELDAPIKAKPLPHPGRWIGAAILLALAAWFVIGAARNEAYHWDVYFKYLLDTRIAEAALHTLALTVLAMLIGIVGGALIAVLRMSDNPVLSTISWVYLWIFRGTPVYVQLVFWGLLGTIYSSVSVGFAELDLQTALQNTFLLAVLGLGLNEAAYMAEIVRAGIQAVDRGQTEAARSLGMTGWQTMRRVVLPQAFKNILPALGNEFVTVIKESSIVMTIGITELMFNTSQVYSSSFRYFESLIVCALIYFVMTFTTSRLLGVMERRMKRDAR